MLIILLILLAFAIYYYGINRFLGLPPGPPPLPIIGNMLTFQWNIDKVFLEWKAKYGRIFTVWLPFPMVVIGDHKVLQEHIVKNGDNFIYRRNPKQMMDIVCKGEYGLTFLANDIVKEQRKFAVKTLHELGFGSAALEDTVHHYAQEIVTRWKNSGEAAVDVTENIMRAVGSIVWNINFGITLEFENPLLFRFREVQNKMLVLMGGPLMMFIEIFPFLRKLDFLFGNQLKRLLDLSEEMNEYLIEAMQTTERSFNPDNQPNSYVEAFLAQQKRRKDSGKPMGSFNDIQRLQSAATLWRAGFDTSVSLLRMGVLELVNHPDVQRKLQKEVDEVIGERRIRYDDQKLLPYMCAFLQEIYRKGNSLPLNFKRITTEDTEIEGHHIAAGTTILPQFSMVHADPNEFERPEYFCHERHLNDEGQFVKDARITPFSVGKRTCLGETLARMEIFVMFSTFVQHCNFRPVGKIPPANEFTTGISRGVVDFHVTIQPRKIDDWDRKDR